MRSIEQYLAFEELRAMRCNAAGICIDIVIRRAVNDKLDTGIQYHFFKDIMVVTYYIKG